MFSSPKTLGVTGGIIGGMGLIPGMPNVAFLTLGAACGGGAYLLANREMRSTEDSLPQDSQPAPPPPKELSWDDVLNVDLVGLEVGYKLIPLVDKSQGGQLMNRIKGVRKKLSQELGFLIPPVHIRDNLELTPNAYRITLHGVPLGEAEIYTEKDLAINPGQVFGDLPGIASHDPAFGLEAVWIDITQRDHAQTLGYTVVDASTVVATHLSQILQMHAHELLGREEVQQLVDKLAKVAPKLVEELIPNALSLGVLLKVLQSLLEENIPIRDMRTIAETLADCASKTQDPQVLTAVVRMALGRAIIQQVNGANEELVVITLDPSLEQILQKTTQVANENGVAIEPGLAERIQVSLQEAVQQQEMAGQPAILLVSAVLRPMLAKYIRRSMPNVHVLSFNEIPDNKQIKVISTVGA